VASGQQKQIEEAAITHGYPVKQRTNKSSTRMTVSDFSNLTFPKNQEINRFETSVTDSLFGQVDRRYHLEIKSSSFFCGTILRSSLNYSAKQGRQSQLVPRQKRNCYFNGRGFVVTSTAMPTLYRTVCGHRYRDYGNLLLHDIFAHAV
jgi:hypothetical protein